MFRKKTIALLLCASLLGACDPAPQHELSASEPMPVDPTSIVLDGKADNLALAAFRSLLDWAQRQSHELLFDGVWTNWSKDGMVLGLVKLAMMRWTLDAKNLHDSYPAGARVGFAPAGRTCAPGARLARSVDGSCNDLDDPLMGAAGVRFGHNVPLAEVRPESEADVLSPSPREISRRLLARDTFSPVPFLNLLAASWIQFMVHDWFSHGDNRAAEAFHVPLAADDPLRARGLSELVVRKTATDPSRSAADRGLPDTYTNEVTHWWDGSQLYGSDEATSRRLRALQGGRLKMDERGLLPLAPDGFEDTGFRRNWWVGLGMMHTLFAREHNAIADMLAARHPDWDDQRLFDVARLVNAAVMAKIHTVEWTPAILPNKTLAKAMNANWYGLFHGLEQLGISGDDPVLFGIVGGKRDLHGVPFSITEEFVSVYRMHSLLPESLQLRSAAGVVEDVPLAATRDQGARALTERYRMGELLASFGKMHPGTLTLHNFPRFLQDLQLPLLGTIDMGTVDIVRDRERGVPRYNRFRRLMQLKPIRRFADLTSDAKVVAELDRVYGGDVEKLDLVVGCLAEAYRPRYFGFGETAFQVFVLMASRRLQADRFFTDSFDAETYTQEGLDWVERATMKSVLLRHHPELAGSGLDRVDNAFQPWN